MGSFLKRKGKCWEGSTEGRNSLLSASALASSGALKDASCFFNSCGKNYGITYPGMCRSNTAKPRNSL